MEPEPYNISIPGMILALVVAAIVGGILMLSFMVGQSVTSSIADSLSDTAVLQDYAHDNRLDVAELQQRTKRMEASINAIIERLYRWEHEGQASKWQCTEDAALYPAVLVNGEPRPAYPEGTPMCVSLEEFDP